MGGDRKNRLKLTPIILNSFKLQCLPFLLSIPLQLNNETGADFVDVSEVLDDTFQEIQVLFPCKFTLFFLWIPSQLNNESGADFFDVSEVLDATFEEIQSGNTDKELLNHIRVQEFQNRLQELQAESKDCNYNQ